MNVSDAIRTFRAVREFRPEPLPDEAVRAILNAGRRGQSSKNSQPWHFVAVRRRETLVALSRTGTYAGHLAGAALGVAIVTPDPSARWSAHFDAGQAAAAMQLAAWEFGIGSAIAAIYEPEPAKALLGIPADLAFEIALSFGYPADERLAKRPLRKGGRRLFDEVVHWETW